MKLSVLILTKNEEDVIEGTLKRLNFADEIIILDQNSKDKTVKIAKKFTDKIFESKNENFAYNRNLLASKAKGVWLLYVDADERIEPQLASEIKSEIKSGLFSILYAPRENYALGKRLRYGGWWPDYVPRLFKKSRLVKWTGPVHETPEVEGRIGYLEIPIRHYSARSMNLMLSKSIKWAKVEASLNFQKKAPNVTIAKALKAFVWEFTRRYVVKKGFLDGTIGLIEAIYQGLHQVMILTYLWEMQSGNNEKDFGEKL